MTKFLLALMVATATPGGTLNLAYHPEATLKVSPASVAAGGSLSVEGSRFEAGDHYKLVLQGVLDEYPLLEVEADAGGLFTLEITIPSEADPGRYRLVALAPDGDASAGVDLSVTAAPAMGAAMADVHEEEAGEHPHDEEMRGGAAGMPMTGGGAMARSDDIVIERNRSGVAWGVIGLLLGLSLGFGAALLKRTPA